MANLSVTSSLSNDTNLVAASFITEVLASAGRLEKDDLNAKLGKLSRRINDVKSEVYEALENEYEHFKPTLNVSPELTERVTTLRQEVKDATEKIQTDIKGQLNTSTTEYQDLSRKLCESTFMSEILHKIMDIHALDEAANDAMLLKDYFTVAKNLTKTQTKLSELSGNKIFRDHDLKVFRLLLNSYTDRRASLEVQLEDTWRKNIKWNLPSAQKDGEVRGSISLRILSSDEAKASMKNTMQALEQLDLLEPKTKMFGKRFLDHIAGPVITKNRRVVTETHIQDMVPCKELTLKSRKNSTSNPKERLAETMEAFIKTFTFINENIGCITITGLDGKDRCVFELLGKSTSEQLLKIMVEKCLSSTIPTSKSDLNGFAAVVECINRFQQKLIKLKYIPESENTLVKYVQNVDVLFANKKCTGILSEARELMKGDLHETISIKCGEQQDGLPDLLAGLAVASTKEGKTVANIAMSAESKLNPKAFTFPSCKISLSCQKLVKLAYEVLHEACQSDTQCALQLFYTVRRMLELYGTVVPVFHKASLIKIPQLAALHYNNCMFITHHVMTIKHQFEPRLPTPLRTSAATLVDLVPQIRRMGTGCFLTMMTSQKNLLLEYLSAANGFVCMSEGDNAKAADRAIRQCLHQLHHLSRVWLSVLPHYVFNKSIGTLVGSVLEAIIQSIIALDDISADDATLLVMLLGVLIEHAPSLFEESAGEEELEKDGGEDNEKLPSSRSVAKGLLLQGVSKWSQLTELHILLNASLQQISDRWAEGKGPLAAEFSANQIKQLIRALFQNTDRRAAVLATIRQPMKK